MREREEPIRGHHFPLWHVKTQGNDHHKPGKDVTILSTVWTCSYQNCEKYNLFNWAHLQCFVLAAQATAHIWAWVIFQYCLFGFNENKAKVLQQPHELFRPWWCNSILSQLLWSFKEKNWHTFLNMCYSVPTFFTSH